MSIEETDRLAAANATGPRVTLETITSRIAEVCYISPVIHPTMTICAMKMVNGFVVIGKSAPADPANFNRELGQRFAREDCIRQLWQLEGYLLRERLHNESPGT
jgi:hypothetical protein